MRLLYLFTLFFCISVNAQETDPPLGNEGPDFKDVACSLSQVQVKPEFADGVNGLWKFIKANFKLPEDNFGNDVLRLYLYFVVEKDGTLSEIKVRANGTGNIKEMERVLALTSGKWSPGTIDGKAVRTRYDLPVSLSLRQ
jgi:protein TonB